MVSQSARVARSPSSQAPNKAIQTGAVYWSKIALAAVVSLLAMAKRTVQPA
jgi:hypothetical protein